MPKVTILLPIFNAEKYIETCLSSLMHQTFTDFEILAINDGSTDGTLEILERLGEKDSRIKIVNQENKGLISTLNKGLGLATGEYIARMDSDDIAHHERIAIQSNYMDENYKCLLCSSDYLTFNDKNGHLKRFKTRQTANFHAAEMIFGPSIAHPTVMFRTEDFARLNLKYNPIYKDAEDYELWTRVYLHGNIKTLPRPLMKIRQHGASITAVAESKTNNEERTSIIGNIHNNYLRHLGINANEEELILHYMLSDRMRFLSNKRYSLKDVGEYAQRLVKKLASKEVLLGEEFAHIVSLRIMKLLYTVAIRKPSDLMGMRYCISLLR